MSQAIFLYNRSHQEKEWSIILRRLLLLIIFSFALTACGTQSTVETGVIKVGTEAVYPPFEKLEGNGTITGFDIDIVKAVAKARNLNVHISNTSWDLLLEGIKEGTYDVGVSAITILPQRSDKCAFSDPYFNSKQLILVPLASKVAGLKDLNGKTIGVQSSTTGEIAVRKALGQSYPNLKGYDDIMSPIDDLALGRLDAVVADRGVVMHYVTHKGQGKFKMVEDSSFPDEKYGFCIHKGNKKLLTELNKGLEQIMHDGTYQKIFNLYFAKD